MPTNSLLESLPDADRAAAESLLIGFETTWAENRLAVEAGRLTGASRLAVLAEMVRIDLERRCGVGRPRDLESYFIQFPELRNGPTGDYLTRVAQKRATDQEDAPTPDGGLPFGPGGRYRILTELGRGATAIVYLAWDTHRQRRVAVKIFHQDLSVEPVVLRAAAGLDHPNICRLYEFTLDPPFVVLAHVDGLPLGRWREDRDLPPRDAATLARAIARAVKYAHGRRVLHRDLKPANVIITAAGEPVLTDFGLAQRDAGNRAYVAPEVAAGRRATPKSDQYALGAVLFFLLTGRHPDPSPPADALAGVDPTLAAICRRAMAERPADRFRSVGRFAAALDDYLVPRRRRLRAAALVVCALAVIGLGVGVTLARKSIAPATTLPTARGPVGVESQP